MAKRMRWRWLVLAAVVVAAVLFALLLLSFTFVDGRFDVPITVWRGGKKLGPDEIKRVSYSRHSLPGETREFVWSEMGPEDRTSSIKDARHDNGAYIATVGWGGRRSAFGRERSHQQPRNMYVEIELKSGQRFRLLCPLADRQHEPEIRIDVGEAPGSSHKES